MWSARSAMVTPRRSASVNRPPDNFSMARSMRAKSSLPCDQIFGRLAMERKRGADVIAELGGDDDVLRRDDIDAMGEGSAAKIGVDQRNDAAHLGDAEPDRQVFGPVRHDEAHRLALAELLRQRPARITVGAVGERAIGQALARREQRWGVAAVFRPAPRSRAAGCAAGCRRSAPWLPARAPSRAARCPCRRSAVLLVLPRGGTCLMMAE